MRPERSRSALDALQRLSEREINEVLGILASERPEAVLAAVDTLRRHQRVVAQLRSESPPGDTLFP